MRRLNDRQVLRVIDANLNRSREGLRVCEDIARFVLSSPSITSKLKRARHSISAIMKSRLNNLCSLYESRDSEADIGRCSKMDSEMKRTDAFDIFSANIQRVKESIRVLEEFLKLVDIRLSARFSRLRFEIYTIEKKALSRADSLRNSRYLFSARKVLS